MSDHRVRGTIVLDWDGTVTESPHWQPSYRQVAVDTELIRACQAAGYAVAISTCSLVSQVAAELEARGYAVLADHAMRHDSWHDGRVILITNRKVHGTIMLDDKAISWRYGRDHTQLWRELERRAGYAWCPGPARHHWGPDGAAGLLPWTVHDGTTWVLLAERSGAVQGGRCWSTVGGAIDSGESAIEAAEREAAEETTGLRAGELSEPFRAACPHGCGWSYTTYPAGMQNGGRLPRVAVRRGPHQWETISVRWIPAGDVTGLNLHPGFAAAWPALQSIIRGG